MKSEAQKIRDDLIKEGETVKVHFSSVGQYDTDTGTVQVSSTQEDRYALLLDVKGNGTSSEYGIELFSDSSISKTKKLAYLDAVGTDLNITCKIESNGILYFIDNFQVVSENGVPAIIILALVK